MSNAETLASKLNRRDRRLVAEAKQQAASFMGIVTETYKKSTEQLAESRKSAERCLKFIGKLADLEAAFQRKFWASLIGEPTLDQLNKSQAGIKVYLDGFGVVDAMLEMGQESRA